MTGSGFVTLAATLAARLGYHQLDSGLLYRATGLAAGNTSTAIRELVRLMESAAASPIAVHRSGCRTASSRTATAAISRIGGRTRRAIPTRLPRRS